MQRKEKGSGQFGRTFFHPPGGGNSLPSHSGYDVVGQTALEGPQSHAKAGSHARAGTQIDLAKVDSVTMKAAKQYMNTRKDGSVDRSSI